MLVNSRFEECSWLRWAAEDENAASICILGIPFDGAVSLSKGAAKAPQTIRELSIDLPDTTDEWIPIRDGLLYDAGDMHPDLQWDRYFASVEKEAYRLMSTGNFCLFIGGDHSVTIPLHKAFRAYQMEAYEKEAQRFVDRITDQKPVGVEGPKLGVIHFDAHFDLWDEYDGHKWSHACTEARALENGVVRPEDLFFIGVRVADLDELELIRRNPGITAITAMEVHEKGIEYVLQRLEQHFAGYDAIYFTIDIDGLDPAFAPGTGTPVMGGVTAIQLIKLFRWVITNLPVKAMDIVEVAPDLDVNNVTSWAALKIIHELFTAFSR